MSDTHRYEDRNDCQCDSCNRGLSCAEFEAFTFQGEVDDEALERALPERDMDGTYFHEIIDDEEFMIQCLECGFIGETCEADGMCPNCGSTDTELA